MRTRRREDEEAALFTGIIEEVGRLLSLRRGYQGAALDVAAETVPSSLQVGDSIAVNGVCLTATHCRRGGFSCDLSSETLDRSAFQQMREGDPLNLERPLAVGGRLGGHIVQGHVDGIGRLLSSTSSGEGQVLEFSFTRDLERYLVSKGSIAVDGISLTISELRRQSFKVAVIPHTWRSTNLPHLRVGSTVNLEADLLAKYFERFIQLGLVQGRSMASSVSSLWEENS